MYSYELEDDTFNCDYDEGQDTMDDTALSPARNSDARSKYFTRLSKVNILTPEEEQTVFTRLQKSDFKDKEAMRTLVESCLRLVVTRAQKFAAYTPELLNELILAGNEGLIEGIRRYKPGKGTRVPSYAIWWVDLYIRTELANRHPVKIPVWRQKKFSAIQRRRVKGYSTEDIMNELKLTEDQVLALEKNKVVAVHGLEPDDFERLVGSDEAVGAEDEAIATSAAMALQRAINKLPVEEQSIVKAYFGIGRESLNLPKIAETRRVSSERVRQIKNRALEQLREHLEEEGIHALDDLL